MSPTQQIADRFIISNPEQDLLGRGGMGAVYRATDTLTGELVAIKALDPRVVARDPELLERFTREGEALRQLNHPNIVRIVAAVEDGGRHYLVMEYVEGGSLQDLLDAQGSLPVSRVLEIALDLADALTRAHRLGIIHRDLKPANVLLAEDGTPRLTDFGIAHVSESPRLTQTGVLVGTPDFLSPEACEGKATDERGDIWAFGVLLFEILTGETPFLGDSLTAKLTAILTQRVPDLGKRCPDAPDALVDLVYRMLEKDREQRIPSVRLVGAELEAIVKGREPITPRPATPGPSATAPRHNLPTQLSTFIGREKEIAQLKRRLGEYRLVTLTGSGGIGKTRLSIETAHEVLPDYRHGTWLVELAPLADPELVPGAVASVLDVHEDGTHSVLTILTDYLREKSLLLVLDNCEHVINACAHLAEHLLRYCPEVRILASSREALGIEGEAALRVPSLSLPPADTSTLELLTQSEAAQLFLDRAATALPGLVLSDADAPAVARICRRLDGISLAIELAASRVKLLKVEQIALRLDDAFRLLTGGSRTALPRQQTLRATIDWSYNLLSEAERTLLRRLAVFAGGATLEAIETVCAGNGVEEYDMLDLLSQLVNKSLVMAERGPSEEPRYSLLEMIRQYARDRLLESNELESVRNRHLDHSCALVETAEPELFSADREPSLERLAFEHDNLRSALRWAAECGHSDMELRLAGALFWFWYHRGYLIEGCQSLEEALSHTSADVLTAARAKALLGAGHLAFYRGDLDTARTRLEDSVRLWRDIGNPRYLAYSLIWFGLVADNPVDCSSRIHESIALFRTLGDEWGLAVAVFYLGANAVLGGTEPRDQEQARSLLEESASRFRRLGDKWQLGGALFYLGVAASEEKDSATAQSRMEEALAIFRQVGDKWRTCNSLATLGNLARAEGNLQRAQALYTESLVLVRELGRPQANVLTHLGYVSLAQGDLKHATAFLVESLQIALQQNQTTIVPTVLAGLAGVAYAEGEAEHAVRLLGAVGRLTEIIRGSKLESVNQTIYDRNLAAARVQLDEAAFNAAWGAGHQMTLEQAMMYALEEITP